MYYAIGNLLSNGNKRNVSGVYISCPKIINVVFVAYIRDIIRLLKGLYFAL